MTNVFIKYKQCELSKGVSIQTSWLPVKFAVVGKFLKLKGDNGWEVKKVFDFAMKEDILKERSQDYKKTRLASDI